MSQKAIIFTHIKSPEEDKLNDIKFREIFIQRNIEHFKAYLSCRNIGLVYVHVSGGLERVIKSLSIKGDTFEVSGRDLNIEQRIISALEMALEKAKYHLINEQQYNACEFPPFSFIGLLQLTELLNTLVRIKPALLNNLAGQRNFTYDSPKFVEAIIRLVRGCTNPIIRIDEDVKVNEAAIQRLIDQWIAYNRENAFFYFYSGAYAGPPKSNGGPMNDKDPVNIHAVRQHWLVTPDTRKTPGNYTLFKRAEQFTRDLGELGATQVEPTIQPSPQVQKLIDQRTHSKNRQSGQVISGAGLVMSVGAIKRLPPFMNAPCMIVWIDEHLKRQLHEAINDIHPDSAERLKDARLVQDRHPGGITDDDIKWAKDSYFERLLCGCLMDSMIKETDGKPGPLAEIVNQIVTFNLLKQNFTNSNRQVLQDKLTNNAQTRLQDALEIWSKANYGDDTLKKWAIDLSKNSTDKNRILSSVVGVAMDYVDLLFDWPDYLNAINILTPEDAFWLFRPFSSLSKEKRDC